MFGTILPFIGRVIGPCDCDGNPAMGDEEASPRRVVAESSVQRYKAYEEQTYSVVPSSPGRLMLEPGLRWHF